MTPTNDPGGYRLKPDVLSQSMQLAQYTAFWHHPNGLCTGDPGWTKTPPMDPDGGGSAAAAAAGSADPKGKFLSGDYGSGGDIIVGGTTTITTYNGVEVTVSRIFDSQGVTQEVRNKATNELISSVRSQGGSIERGNVQAAQRARTGRTGWKELIR
ncbi:hypothetical protein [Sphaerotilus microaerophilus]|nr:hypothetical protein [Sphaerotilus sp. FB-5]